MTFASEVRGLVLVFQAVIVGASAGAIPSVATAYVISLLVLIITGFILFREQPLEKH